MRDSAGKPARETAVNYHAAMLRRTRMIGMFLLLGAVVNIAVAWAGSALSRVPTLTRFLEHQPGEHQWPAAVPVHWPQRPEIDALEGNFWTITQYNVTGIELMKESGETLRFRIHDRHVHEISSNDTITATESFLIVRYDFGWPMRSMGCERWEESIIEGDPPRWVSRFEGHPDSSIWLDGLQIGYGFKVLPLRPSGLRFLVNSLFYAALLWLLVCGPFKLRAALRRKRRLCVACAYPMSASLICTECGAATRL